MCRKFLLCVFYVCLLMVGTTVSQADTALQSGPTATPAQIMIVTPTPPVTEQGAAQATVTRTPTPIGAALIEAKPDAGDVNVRAQPDPGAEKLGTIRAGDKYPIIGRYFRWLQFQYDQSPSKTGWVFEELVNIIGDPATINDLNANLLPTVDTSFVNATQTWEAVMQIPGGVLTVTADSRVIAAPEIKSESTAGANTDAHTGGNSSALPTFTYPPNVVAQAPTPNAAGDVTPTAAITDLSSAVSNGVAPIVPILVLGGLGILGLLLSSIRRS